MAKTEKLPKYVSSFVDNRGKRRYRFRKAGCKNGYFEDHPNSVKGRAEYDAFLASEVASAVERKPMVTGSIDHLISLYYPSTDFRGNAAETSLAKRRAVIEAFRAEHGHRTVKGASFINLDKYIAKIAKGWTDEKGRAHGGAFAAETARKQLRGLFKFAVKISMRPDNPMDHVNYRPKKTPGFHSWTESEIEQYRDRWPLGTKQRLAMEIGLWTGKRRNDAIRMGPQHIEGGELIGRDTKTGKSWVLPIAPQLQAAIDAMPKGHHLCFVPSDRGRPYSAASFGNMFRVWCDEAGLEHCSFHGLRKAISRRAAEEGIGNAGIKSITLHSRDEEVSLYVAAADQKRLSKDAISRISQAEVSSAASRKVSSK
ncbi:tyrosine-type recombinase/integrase [Novosphingobium sp. KN65.2]|uniref:tyrosine-type recombinase/integrase n=1 Tax=Novosphingobium sp. KN65.2 TaxID=1478134 RepID=UPI0005E99069|nr:tyrosine-type recombinase/integrase [Novosphingobium sp. KN65.2]CDO37638.1 putative Phage integrase [Novosphingobium sp. KN65.2]